MRIIKRKNKRRINKIVGESFILGFAVMLAFSTGAGAVEYASPADTPAASKASTAQIGLELKADGLTAPLAAVSPDDRSGRLFIVDQIGVIKILTADGKLLNEPFLDIRDKIVALNTAYDERGLLGLAFHPDYKENGRFYIYYSAPLRQEAPRDFDHTNVVAEFKVAQGNPDKADASSERLLLQEDNPESNHNAGQITFGTDGYLYIPIGDGGGANDVGVGHPPSGNGQNTSTLQGKILRIDVDSGNPYGIPADNPFANGTGGLPEIYAYGLRNPFHIAFDAGGNNDLFSQDAGQDLWEEIDIITRGGNYGWNIKEGTHCFDPANNKTSPATCPDTGAKGEPLIDPILIDPIIEFANAKQPGGLAFVVIGGYVYRGSALPELDGNYIFGGATRSLAKPDGSLFIATPSAGEKMWQMSELNITTSKTGRIDNIVRSFGQDDKKELYVLASEILGPTGNTGKVFKIIPAAPNVTATPNVTVSPNVTATITPTATVTGAPAVTGTPKPPTSIPEFPALVLPVAAVIGLMILLLYRRDK